MKKINIAFFFFFVAIAFNSIYSQNTINFELLNKLNNKNKLDSITTIINKINKDTTSLKSTEKSKYYLFLGSFYDKKDDEEQAFTYLKKAADIFIQTKNEKKLMLTYYQIYRLLTGKKELKADREKYLKKVEHYALKEKDSSLLLNVYDGYALDYLKNNKFDSATIYYQKVLLLAKTTQNNSILAATYNNLGIVYGNKKKIDSARYYYKKAIETFKKINKKTNQFAITYNIASTFIDEQKYTQAINWFNKADSIQLKKYKNSYKKLLYKKMAETFSLKKDYKNAFTYLQKHQQYKDSVNAEKQKIAILDMETKYKAIEKEKENIQLKADKKQQRLFLYGLIGLFIFIATIGYSLYANLKRKKEVIEKEKKIIAKEKELEHQKVISLVKDQEVLTMNAMIEGQENERLRLAEELHDNLGSSLATLKMHFDAFRNGLANNKDTAVNLLNSTEEVLNETYQKVREMAHTNHVSVMAAHGLIPSIYDLTERIKTAKNIAIEITHYGFENPIDSSLELNVFRIIQELITNIIKHAKAEKIAININLFEDSLSLIIEDDGIGFDLNKIQSKGIGLKNLFERVKRDGGTLTIDSNIGQGTIIIIEIPFKDEI